MAEIRWTVEAEIWLADIYDYISKDNPSAAARVTEGIYQKAQILKQFPDIGYKYRSEDEGEVRILLYGHYRIAYLRRNNQELIIRGKTPSSAGGLPEFDIYGKIRKPLHCEPPKVYSKGGF